MSVARRYARRTAACWHQLDPPGAALSALAVSLPSSEAHCPRQGHNRLPGSTKQAREPFLPPIRQEAPRVPATSLTP